MERKQKVGGMSFGSGRGDKFFLCLLEYFADSSRWFLRSVLAIRGEDQLSSDDTIVKWFNDNDFHHLVGDFPVSSPSCLSCQHNCPSINACQRPEVKNVRFRMQELLEEDALLYEKDPKQYERRRHQIDESKHRSSPLERATADHLLSKSFKRRLKKGFLPYWNRPVDFWVWGQYYDPMLDLFNVSYDSFGDVSPMLLFRLQFLQSRIERPLEIFEGNVYLALIELMRSGLIQKEQILGIQQLEQGVEARLDVIRELEKQLAIFIYEKDLETLVKNPRAFHSFLLAIIGQAYLEKRTFTLPSWTRPQSARFVVPDFASVGLGLAPDGGV